MSTPLAVTALVLVIGLAAVTFLLLGAQVEMFRNLTQLREQAGLSDRPTPVSLGKARGTRASDVGLPAALDDETSAVVLFLSDKCFVCRSIAAGLAGTLPHGVWLVLDPGTAPRDAQLSPTLGFDTDDVTIDPDRTIMKRIGIESTPLTIVVEHGRLARASGITSTRQLYETVGATVPTYVQLQAHESAQEGISA